VHDRLLFATLQLLFLAGSIGAAPGTGELAYLIRILDPARHLVEVQVTLPSSADDAVLGWAEPEGLARELRPTDLEFVPQRRGPAPPRFRNGRIRLPSGTRGLRYRLQLDRTQRRFLAGRVGYLGPTYLLTRVAWLLLLPQGPAPSAVRVDFELPRGWGAVAPFEAADRGFRTTDWAGFPSAVLAAGRFHRHRFEVGDTAFTLAVDEAFSSSERARLIAGTEELSRSVKQAFRAAGPPRHLTVLARASGPGEAQLVNEGPTSHGEACDSVTYGLYQVHHRLFHTYNAGGPHGLPAGPAWFLEGVDEFLGEVAFLRAGIGEPLSRLRSAWRDAYVPRRAELDAPLAGVAMPSGRDLAARVEFLAYKKGALVAALLDREIRRRSRGSGELATVLAGLYRRFPPGTARPLGEAEIRAEVNRVAGADLGAFFRRYLDGTELLPVGELLTDDDRDGLPALAEELLGTDPRRADSDRDGVADGAEYREGHDPADAADRPAPGVVVDGTGDDWDGLAGTRQLRPRRGVGVRAVHVRSTVDGLEIRADFVDAPRLEPHLRYYVNLDLGPGRDQRQVAAVPGGAGDTSRLTASGASEDWRSLADVPGASAAIGDVLEIRVPRELTTGGRARRAWVGIWDTRAGRGVGDTGGWLDL
jgi:hypothetical protein